MGSTQSLSAIMRANRRNSWILMQIIRRSLPLGLRYRSHCPTGQGERQVIDTKMVGPLEYRILPMPFDVDEFYEKVVKVKAEVAALLN